MLHFERLAKNHNRQAFDCGDDSLNGYFRQQARQDEQRRLNAVHVAVDETLHNEVIGYYTLCATSVKTDNLPATRKLPNYPIPAILLGRLAVDTRFQGRGLGKILVADAIKKVITAQESVGIHVLVVDARTEDLIHFYENLGFKLFPPAQRRLYLFTESFT